MSAKKFEITCEHKGSYAICYATDDPKPNFGKPAMLVRCDREDLDDNERGMKLSNRICEFLNNLPEEEVQTMLSGKMMPND